VTDNILDLSALTVERPKARIKTDADPDGTIFELAIPEDFGVVEMARLSRMVTEFDTLYEAESRSKAEDKRLEALQQQITQILIPDAPAEAVKALPFTDKRGLAVQFFVKAGLAQVPYMQVPEGYSP